MASIFRGSPSFRLYWNDLWPILKGGFFVGSAAGLAHIIGPVLGVTEQHFSAFVLVSGLAGTGLQALVEFLKNKAKG